MGIRINKVRDFIKSGNLKPSDVFGLGDLTKDPMIVEYFDRVAKKAVTDAYKNRKKAQKEFKKLKEKMIEVHKKEIKEIEDLIATYRNKER